MGLSWLDIWYTNFPGMYWGGVSLPPPLVLEEEDFSTLRSAGEDKSSLAKQHGILWSFPVAGHRDLTLDLDHLPGKKQTNTALFLLRWGGEATVNQCCRTNARQLMEMLLCHVHLSNLFLCPGGQTPWGPFNPREGSLSPRLGFSGSTLRASN